MKHFFIANRLLYKSSSTHIHDHVNWLAENKIRLSESGIIPIAQMLEVNYVKSIRFSFHSYATTLGLYKLLDLFAAAKSLQFVDGCFFAQGSMKYSCFRNLQQTGSTGELVLSWWHVNSLTKKFLSSVTMDAIILGLVFVVISIVLILLLCFCTWSLNSLINQPAQQINRPVQQVNRPVQQVNQPVQQVNSTRTCYLCIERREWLCFRCFGMGNTWEISLDGRGQRRYCYRCSGSGHEECWNCHGSGIY